jgi:hypothetical protein
MIMLHHVTIYKAIDLYRERLGGNTYQLTNAFVLAYSRIQRFQSFNSMTIYCGYCVLICSNVNSTQNSDEIEIEIEMGSPERKKDR